jgi:hypothetical protein
MRLERVFLVFFFNKTFGKCWPIAYHLFFNKTFFWLVSYYSFSGIHPYVRDFIYLFILLLLFIIYIFILICYGDYYDIFLKIIFFFN